MSNTVEQAMDDVIHGKEQLNREAMDGIVARLVAAFDADAAARKAEAESKDVLELQRGLVIKNWPRTKSRVKYNGHIYQLCDANRRIKGEELSYDDGLPTPVDADDDNARDFELLEAAIKEDDESRRRAASAKDALNRAKDEAHLFLGHQAFAHGGRLFRIVNCDPPVSEIRPTRTLPGVNDD
jgi:hypothetical protein